MSVSVQDRTAEFQAILSLEKRKTSSRQRKPAGRGLGKALQPNSLWNGSGSAAATNQDRLQSQPLLDNNDADDGASLAGAKQPKAPSSEFSRKAAHVAQGITATMTKLDRLARLARQRSLLDDRATEIQRLTSVIKQDIDGLNGQIKSLQTVVVTKKSAGFFSSQTDGQMTDDERAHSSKVVVMLQESLVDVGSSFKNVLEVRSKNMQSSSSRTANLITPSSSAAVAGAAAPGVMGSSQWNARTDSPLYSASLHRPGGGNTPNPPRPSSAAPAQSMKMAKMPMADDESDALTLEPPPPINRPASTSHQLLLMEEGQTSSQYLQERGDAIVVIEKTITELGSIFSQLAQMVSEQSEMVERIDANTAEVVDNVAGAHRELTKYWKSVSSNRWLVIKMVGVLMVFFLLWVLISA